MDLFGTRRRRIAELQAWAAGRAIQFDRLEGADPERLAPLDGLLRNKRLVFLGEADHFVHEVFTFRLLLLRYLVERSFRWIGEELGVCDGLRIDRYLETGDESWLDRLPSFGYRGAQRADRDDSLSGLFRSGEYPLEPMRAAHAELARRLRLRASGQDRLRWFGVDGDNAPGGAYEDVERLLAGGGAAARALSQELARVPGELLEQEVERLGAVLEQLSVKKGALENEIGTEATAQLPRSLLALREGLIFVRDSRSAASWGELAAPMARREKTMVEQARSVLAAAPADERFVLLGHAAHLSKDWPSARRLEKGAGPPSASLGTQLARAYPGQVLSIWLLHGWGSDSQPLASLPRELTLTRGSLNEALAQLGACFLLPLGTAEALPALLRGEQEVRWIYNAGCLTQIARQADALFFVREATPLQRAPRLD
ncbi:MAG: hypothetical protein A2V77_08335 [Anaeromyxobacter sp. RBG_16_69_14]|nr:MAG: hypothetical protein A2V77_08335 [Anaeromyxobacter sp. RBG_16_69_14]